MMDDHPVPLKVGILEDDWLARLSAEQLLGRDLRTEVMAAFDRPEQLLAWLRRRRAKKRPFPHVWLIDAEYEGAPGLAGLVSRLQEQAPRSTVVILSQYGGEILVRLAAETNVGGLVLKREIGLAVATAVYLARTTAPVFSSALEPVVEELAGETAVRRWWREGRRLPRWRLLPEIPPRQREVTWQCLIFGLSARLAGEEIALAKDSVDKYRSLVYDKIADHALGQLDLAPLEPVMNRLYRRLSDAREENAAESIYTGDDWAFHYLTQLPRRDVDRRLQRERTKQPQTLTEAVVQVQ